MRLHDMHLYDFLFGLRITNWHGQTVAPVWPESILGHGPSVFQRCLHALRHARDQGLRRQVAPRNPQQLPAERREGVRLLHRCGERRRTSSAQVGGTRGVREGPEQPRLRISSAQVGGARGVRERPEQCIKF